MTAQSAPVGAVSGSNLSVWFDHDLPACVHVSRRLGADLWAPHGDEVFPLAKRLVIVASRPKEVEAIRQAIANDKMRPALVVSWALPEEHVVTLLGQKIPVVDGSVLFDDETLQKALLGANGRWTSDDFAREAALAQELDRIERIIALPDPAQAS